MTVPPKSGRRQRKPINLVDLNAKVVTGDDSVPAALRQDGSMLFRRWRTPKSGPLVLANALYRHDRRDRERIDRWWAAGGDDRARVSRAAWLLLHAAFFRFGNHERPAQVAPVLEFLLEPEPSSPHLPRVRLTACLPPYAGDLDDGEDLGDPEVQRLVDAALEYPDPGLRQRLADLLSGPSRSGRGVPTPGRPRSGRGEVTARRPATAPPDRAATPVTTPAATAAATTPAAASAAVTSRL